MWTQNQEGFLPEWFTTYLYFWIRTSNLYSWRRRIFINDNSCYKVRNDSKMLLNGCLELIFIKINFDKKKKIIVGLIYRHPRIECLNKIALLDNTCILMGDFNIDLLKSHANNVTSRFLEVMTSCFFVPYIQQPTRVVGSSQH